MMAKVRFDPDVERYLRVIGDRPPLPLNASGVEALRQRYRSPSDAAKLPKIEIGAIHEDSVAGRSGAILLRRYLPAGRGAGAQPAILFFHGGGWVAGDLDCQSASKRDPRSASNRDPLGARRQVFDAGAFRAACGVGRA